jgi:hypothetical protein
MSALRSSVWSIVLVIVAIIVGVLAYGSCYSQP